MKIEYNIEIIFEGVMFRFITLIVVMGTRVYAYVQTYQITYINNVQCFFIPIIPLAEGETQLRALNRNMHSYVNQL